MSRTIIGLICVCLITGCGTGDAEVSGLVLMDQQPLAEGEIIFEAIDGTVTPVGGKIENGHYTINVLPGIKKVKISSSRPLSKIDPVMGMAAKENRLGEEYNIKSKIQVDIKPGKNEGVNFDVKELPRGK